jgi:putative membrane protein
MMHWVNGTGDWGMTLIVLGTVLLWVLLIAGIAALVSLLGRRNPRPGSDPGTARRVLADRLAHGEIDDEEYMHQLYVLENNAQAHRVSG